jgi:hypothetical protein
MLPAAAAGQSSNSKLSDLSWISGCWETVAERGAVTTERWGPAASDMLIGASQTVKGGKTVSYEFLRIVMGDKGPSYVARPSSAKEDTEFKFLRSSNSEIVFENFKNDFPQRIIYKPGGADGLVARIEGEIGGKSRGTDFRMTRVKC